MDSSALNDLRTKIFEQRDRVGIIGLGSIGLPLVRAFYGVGRPVLGFDTDPGKVERLRSGQKCGLIITDDWSWIVEHSALVVDTRDATGDSSASPDSSREILIAKHR